jgi:transcriptional regulator with GAF, ATPase, and Fis domain
MSIPMFKTHQPTPKVVKEPVKIPDLETMQNLLNSGVVDVVQQLIEQYKLPLKIENGKIVDALKGTELYLSKFLTQNQECLELKEQVRKLAKIPDEVLITGETGTGKELIARAMIGDRQGLFVAANCAGLPEHLIESELFGHVRGAFTGAESSKQGMFAVARGGIMFLDEIGELPIGVQAKLLRAIQDKMIRRVGSNTEEEIDCKFVCATHRNLKKMVKDSHFREDLYARISTFELHIPPLRDRIFDFVIIAEAEKGGKEFVKALREANARVEDIDLSLNVRAIQRCVKRYNVLGKLILS